MNDTVSTPVDPGPPAGPAPSEPARRTRTMNAWLVLGAVLAVLFVAQGALWAFAVIGRQSDSLSQTRPAQQQLVVRLSSGDVRVTADPEATSSKTIILDAERSWSQSRPRITWRQVGGALELRVDCVFTLIGWCSADLDLRVPQGTQVSVESDSGDVTAKGLPDVNLATDSGRLSASDVTGEVVLRTDSGSIDVDRASGQIELLTYSGDIDLVNSATKFVVAQADSGSIRLDLTTDPERVFASADSGNVTVQVPDTPGIAYQLFLESDSGTRNGAVRTDPSAPRSIAATTDSGDVVVSYR